MGRNIRPELEKERLAKYKICKQILTGTLERVSQGEGIEISRGQGRSRIAVWKKFEGDRINYSIAMQNELISVSRCLRAGQNLAIAVKKG